MLKLDLACGKRCKPGFIGVDISPDCEADVICDLSKTPWVITCCDTSDKWLWGHIDVGPNPPALSPLTFKSGCVEEASCCHFFEHLTGSERIAFMEELWRVLKAGAKATITTPHWTSERAVQDPTHQWPPLAAPSYLYFNREWREKMGLDHYPIKCNFSFIYQHVYYPFPPPKDDNTAPIHYVNHIDDLVAVLTKEP